MKKHARYLGVHAIGTGATELIHIGQAVMAFKGTVDYFINNVFNYPTLAECYKVAALNGSNKLRLLWNPGRRQRFREGGVRKEPTSLFAALTGVLPAREDEERAAQRAEAQQFKPILPEPPCPP